MPSCTALANFTYHHSAAVDRRRAAGLDASGRFTNPQVPLAQQANLFAGVAFLHHAVDKVVVFFCSSVEVLALNEMTGNSSSVLENIFFSITVRSFS